MYYHSHSVPISKKTRTLSKFEFIESELSRTVPQPKLVRQTNKGTKDLKKKILTYIEESQHMDNNLSRIIVVNYLKFSKTLTLRSLWVESKLFGNIAIISHIFS